MKRIILSRKKKDRNANGTLDSDIVICFLPDNTATPFVTWVMTHATETIPRGFHHGHYFTKIIDAANDFEGRT